MRPPQTPLQPPAPQPPAAPPRLRWFHSVPRWAWVVAAVIAVVLLIVLARVVVVLAVVTLITGIVSLVKSTPTWLRFKTRKAATLTIAVSLVVMLVASGISSAQNRNADKPAASEPRGLAAVAPAATAPVDSKPSPTPVTTTQEVTERIVIPFERETIDDPGLDEGTVEITTVGAEGERIRIFLVTLTDGVETGREVLSDDVTAEPVTEITSRGTYVAPATIAQPPAEQSCDPNYADACVPIASDVDCGWGSGDGPEYLHGVARVVGVDLYQLDRDGDGLACERD